MKFIEYIKKHYRTITLTSYLLPILFAVIVSLAHVVTFWEVSNPASWAIFLSIAVEVAVLSSIAASRFSNWAWLPFGIVTLIQMIGNIFFSFTHIDVTSELFRNWVELFDPLFNWLGFGTNGDLVIHRRILAMFSGGMIPLMSMTFFYFFIRTVRETGETDTVITEIPDPPVVDEVPVIEPVVEEPIVEPVVVPEVEEQPTKSVSLEDQRQAIYNKWDKSGLLAGLTPPKTDIYPAVDLFNEPVTINEPEPEVQEPEEEEIIDPNQLELFKEDETKMEQVVAEEPVVEEPVVEEIEAVEPTLQDKIAVIEGQKKK